VRWEPPHRRQYAAVSMAEPERGCLDLGYESRGTLGIRHQPFRTGMPNTIRIARQRRRYE
jgi:hypothetical protein